MRKIICLVAMAAALLTSASASPAEVVCELPVSVPTLSTEYPGSDVSCLGCIVADAVRGASGAEVALVNSGDLAGDLSQKTVTREDVRNVFREDRPLAVAALSAEELAQVLEHALSCIVVDSETERIDRAVDHLRQRYGYMSVRRALLDTDPRLGHINVRDDHTVHPVGYFGG